MSSILPNIGELIGMIYDFGQPLFSALTPFLWYLIGIPLAFLFAGGIITLISNKFNDWLDWREEKRELNEISHGFRELLGSKTGENVFTTFRLADQLSDKPLDPLKFITPRDWMAGQTMFDALKPGKTGIGPEMRQYGWNIKTSPYGESPAYQMNPIDKATYPIRHFGSWVKQVRQRNALENQFFGAEERLAREKRYEKYKSLMANNDDKN